MLFLRKFKNFFNLRTRMFHFPRYKKFFGNGFFGKKYQKFEGRGWKVRQVALKYATDHHRILHIRTSLGSRFQLQ